MPTIFDIDVSNNKENVTTKSDNVLDGVDAILKDIDHDAKLGLDKLNESNPNKQEADIKYDIAKENNSDDKNL